MQVLPLKDAMELQSLHCSFLGLRLKSSKFDFLWLGPLFCFGLNCNIFSHPSLRSAQGSRVHASGSCEAPRRSDEFRSHKVHVGQNAFASSRAKAKKESWSCYLKCFKVRHSLYYMSGILIPSSWCWLWVVLSCWLIRIVLLAATEYTNTLLVRSSTAWTGNHYWHESDSKAEAKCWWKYSWAISKLPPFTYYWKDPVY